MNDSANEEITDFQRSDSMVVRLNLSFPYDWSNPLISETALIINVLKRGIFEDICKVCIYFGLGVVDDLAKIAFKDEPSLIYPRMINNIRKGLELND